MFIHISDRLGHELALFHHLLIILCNF